MTEAARGGLRKLKLAARAIGKLQAGKKRKGADSVPSASKRARIEANERVPEVTVRMAKLKAAVKVVGAVKAAPKKKARKKATMIAARLARFG